MDARGQKQDARKINHKSKRIDARSQKEEA
jgi:hypothetical protein